MAVYSDKILHVFKDLNLTATENYSSDISSNKGHNDSDYDKQICKLATCFRVIWSLLKHRPNILNKSITLLVNKDD